MPACPCRRSSSSRSTALAARVLCAAALTCTALLVRDHSPHRDSVCLRGALFPLHPQHWGTVTGSKGSQHNLSLPILLQTLVSFQIYCLLIAWFSCFSFPVNSVVYFFISKGMSSCCQSRPLTAVGVTPWTSPQRCQCSSRQGLGLGPCLGVLLPLFSSPDAFT